MTPKIFKAKVESMFLKSNPGAKIGPWKRGPKLVRYPTGVWGWMGVFIGLGNGIYRDREVLCEYDSKFGWIVR